MVLNWTSFWLANLIRTVNRVGVKSYGTWLHEATGSTQSELFLQQPPGNLLSALIDFPPGTTFDPEQRLIMSCEIQQSKAESRKRRHAEKGKPGQYNTGDLVLVRTYRLSSSVNKCIHKFFMLYEGPFVVSEIKHKNAYAFALILLCWDHTFKIK